MSAITYLDEKTFDETLTGSDKPILVDFWAEWCGPCKAMNPILEEIASENNGFKVAKLNTDDNIAIAQRFNVMSIPTLILFKNGEPVWRGVGARPKSRLLEEIKDFL